MPVRIDLHCHSTHSPETLPLLPGLVFHPLLDPTQSYDLAKARGMDFVTLTDHDTIEGCLRLLDARGPLPDFIVGEEVSASFPEDGTVVHVNVYGHTEAQHREIQKLRRDIYNLTAFLSHSGLLFVLNHLTWLEQSRMLRQWQLETLLELFPVLEGLNGSRTYAHNAFVWYASLGLKKVLVGGSDSHTDRVGLTWTESRGSTSAELLANIRAGHALPHGQVGTPAMLREDVDKIIQAEFDLRLSQACGRCRRASWHLVRGLGLAMSPLLCGCYNLVQMGRIRRFLPLRAALQTAR